MDQPLATYSLARIQHEFSTSEGLNISVSATLGYLQLGFTMGDVLIVIAQLTPSQLHKTMASRLHPGFYQDVYRSEH